MKKLVLAACALACVFGASSAPAARADETTPDAPKKAVQWVEGWKAGVEAAKKSGKLMFVYVHRITPT